MWKLQVKQKMDAAFEETLEIFEKTAAEYEEKLTRLRETERQFKKLKALLDPKIGLHRLDGQQTVTIKLEAPEDEKPVVDQQGTVRIKDEKMNPWPIVKREQPDVKEEQPDVKETAEFLSVAVKTEQEDK